MTKQELYYRWELRQQLAGSVELLTSLEAKAAPRVQRLDGMPHAAGVRDPVGDLAAEIADLKERVGSLRNEIAHTEAATAAWIRTIEDDRTRLVFRLRFIRGLAWGEVADLIGGRNTENSVKALCQRYLKAHPEPSQGEENPAPESKVP